MFFLAACGFWLPTLDLRAQTNIPVQPHPLMQLMTTQPSVDINATVIATALFDPSFVGLNEKIIYRITMNALEASVRFPQQIPLPEGLKMELSSRGQVLQSGGNILRPMTALNFRVRAERPGFYAIPTFDLEVYGKAVRVPPTYLEVREDAGPERKRARELILQPIRTNVFLGESVKVRVLLPGSISNVVETLSQLQLNGEGILEDKSVLSQKIEPVDFNGRQVATWVIESSVTPFAAGRRTLTAQAFTAGRQFSGPVVISGQTAILGGLPQFTLLDSDPVTIQVRPLPPETTTKGFNGFIGGVSLDRPRLGTNFLRVGDAVRLLVTFRSEVPLTRLVPPPPPQAANWQIFPAMPADLPPSAAPPTNQVATFAYTLIPLTEEARRTPAIPFSVFDSEKAAYVDLTIPPLDVKVVAEGLPVDWKPAAWAGETRSEQKLSLSALSESPGKPVGSLVPLQMRPWFVVAQLIPALALFGLWYWDRRRRFFESHPDLARRRQAKRALRREKRELQRAAARGDAPGFARRAITALQVAAAPHFPAEPRALVCGEVLSIFEEAEKRGRTGEIIRSLFAREERAAFAARREGHAPLFDLQPELEGILNKMEARL